MAERFVSVSEDELCEKCIIKQLLDEIEHDIMNYQNRGLCYLPKPKETRSCFDCLILPFVVKRLNRSFLRISNIAFLSC